MSVALCQEFDAAAELGFGAVSTKPLPVAASDELVIRYGGWSVMELVEQCPNAVDNRSCLWQAYPWLKCGVAAGDYRIRPAVLNSNNKGFRGQSGMLQSRQYVTPLVLIATTLLVWRHQWVLRAGRGVRCPERTRNGMRASLWWGHGKLFIHDEDEGGNARPHIWISSCELVEPL